MDQKNDVQCVTLISTLPPLRAGLGDYTLGLVQELSKLCKIDFIGFKSLYPAFLYRGGNIYRNDVTEPYIKNVIIHNIIAWYNPFSWIRAGFSIRGDIVHFQWWSLYTFPEYFTIACIAKYVKRKKIIFTVHDITPHEKTKQKIHKFLSRILFHFSFAYIVHSKAHVDIFCNMYHVLAKKVFVISHGIISNYSVCKCDPADARQKLKINQNAPTLLFFGNIREYKGLDVLIHAFSQVKKEFSHAILIIAGSMWHSWNNYQKLIEEYHLESSVRLYLHFIPHDLAELIFCASDIVVLPYKNFEAQSGVASVALSFEKPLVISDFSGLRDFVRDEGVVVSPGESGALSKKIKYIMGNKNFYEKLKNDAQTLKKELSWNIIAQKTFSLYNVGMHKNL